MQEPHHQLSQIRTFLEIIYPQFPEEKCGEGVDLVKRVLSYEASGGVIWPENVQVNKLHRFTHLWNVDRTNGLIIDISSDQFLEEGKQRIVIVPEASVRNKYVIIPSVLETYKKIYPRYEERYQQNYDQFTTWLNNQQKLL